LDTTKFHGKFFVIIALLLIRRRTILVCGSLFTTELFDSWIYVEAFRQGKDQTYGAEYAEHGTGTH